ncbi:hypothetical protein ACWKSP_37090 [Micromonosporaceae bacterium Da 78-11]
MAVLVGAGIAGIAAASPADSGSDKGQVDPLSVYEDPAWPKSERPININPDKQPVLNPPARKEAAPAKVAPAELLHEANDIVAEDPGSKLICYGADGVVVGVAVVNKVSTGGAIAGADAICDRGWPGSHA